MKQETNEEMKKINSEKMDNLCERIDPLKLKECNTKEISEIMIEIARLIRSVSYESQYPVNLIIYFNIKTIEKILARALWIGALNKDVPFRYYIAFINVLNATLSYLDSKSKSRNIYIRGRSLMEILSVYRTEMEDIYTTIKNQK